MNRKFICTLLLLAMGTVLLGAEKNPFSDYDRFIPEEEEKDTFEEQQIIGVEDVLPSPPLLNTPIKKVFSPSPKRPDGRRSYESPFSFSGTYKKQTSKKPFTSFLTPPNSTPVSPETLKEDPAIALNQLQILYKEAITKGIKINKEQITVEERLIRQEKSLESGLISQPNIKEEIERIRRKIDLTSYERLKDSYLKFKYNKEGLGRKASFADKEKLTEVQAYNPIHEEGLGMHGTHKRDYEKGGFLIDKNGNLIPLSWYTKSIHRLETIAE